MVAWSEVHGLDGSHSPRFVLFTFDIGLSKSF